MTRTRTASTRACFIAALVRTTSLLTSLLAAGPLAAQVSIDAPTQATASRLITTDDLIGLRDIVSMALSPDGEKYAILVQQADVDANGYRTEWFVGSTSGGRLLSLGNGGEPRLRVSPAGRRVGYLMGEPGRWSPDGRWLAYTAQHGDEVQVWVSEVATGRQRQLTRNAANVRDFAWSEDGSRLLFRTGSTRQERAELDERGRRSGFLLEEFQWFNEIIHDMKPDRPLETELTVWAVGVDGSDERRADDSTAEEFERARARGFSWGRSEPEGSDISRLTGAAAPPVVAVNGALAWLARDVGAPEEAPVPPLRLMAAPAADSAHISCGAAECVSQLFSKVWWSDDGERVIFWRKQDVNLVENGFYAWTPATGAVKVLYHDQGDEFRECELAGDRVICARETLTRPAHVAAIDIRTGAVEVIADVNPDFRNIRLGRVERFEWDAPHDAYELGYPRRMWGYVLYPPDFDPARRYPVFIAPYGAPGFRRGDVGDEQPLYVYAANGFVVISSQFPLPLGSMATRSYSSAELYDPDHGFPHLTMLSESTFRALDAVAALGIIDETRVGIGGLSHGTFIPLRMVQTEDRLSALSLSGPGWSQFEYYMSSRTARALNDVTWPESREFWSLIDMADHVEAIEAPILVHYADREFFHDLRLPRRMENGERAYEAFVFPDEHHVKWQPAHRYAIYNRNLDWFRFWLQDVEDPDPGKTGQYERWRELRELQCRNPRSVRDYCSVATRQLSVAR